MGRASQPQVQTSTAPGYVFAWASSIATDMASGIRSVINGTGPTFGLDNYSGQVVRKAIFAGGTSGAANLNFGSAKAIADVMFNSSGGTLHLLLKPKSTTNQALIGKDDNNVNSGWLISNANVYTFNVVNTGSDAGNPWLTVVNVGTWTLLSVTTNGNSSVASSGMQLYTNGKADNGTFVNGSGTTLTDAGNSLAVGGTAAGSYNFGTTIDANADIALFALCRRQQSPAEVLAFARNPWAIFAKKLPTYADAVSSGIFPRRYGMRLAGVGLIPLTPPANVVYEA